MDKVHKPSDSVCHTPSSDPFKVYIEVIVFKSISEFIFLKTVRSDVTQFAYFLHRTVPIVK
jgi:hypothetical protein